jgi:hypothetical protein
MAVSERQLLALTWAMAGQKWGNFISLSGLNTGRFLDPPELTVIHAKGSEENVFDGVDYQLSKADSIQLNLWFHEVLVPESKQLRQCTS